MKSTLWPTQLWHSVSWTALSRTLSTVRGKHAVTYRKYVTYVGYEIVKLFQLISREVNTITRNQWIVKTKAHFKNKSSSCDPVITLLNAQRWAHIKQYRRSYNQSKIKSILHRRNRNDSQLQSVYFVKSVICTKHRVLESKYPLTENLNGREHQKIERIPRNERKSQKEKSEKSKWMSGVKWATLIRRNWPEQLHGVAFTWRRRA